jgi:hypothetical protein
LIRKASQRVHKTNSEIDRNLVVGSIIGDMGVGFEPQRNKNKEASKR